MHYLKKTNTASIVSFIATQDLKKTNTTCILQRLKLAVCVGIGG